MKKGFILFAVVLFFLFGNAWAADEAAIEELQTDVSVTKTKADQNAAEIQSLKGGLPAEAAARAAADTELQNQIDAIELTPGPEGPPGPTLGIYDSLSLDSSGGLAPGNAGGMTLYNLGDVGIGTSSVDTGVRLDVSGGNLEIDHGSHMGAATNDAFTYDGDPMGWYSIGWKPDSWFSYGNTAWIAGYGGIKFFTGGMQPALTIAYWGETWVANNLTVSGDIYKTGTVSFVERHPADPSKAIVYVSLEGGEAGTYCRGTATLQNGMAWIELPEHFSLVTSDNGLTVQVTPSGPSNGLYVVSKSNTSIEVRELGDGTSNVSFDWIIHGVRKGHEMYDPITSDPALIDALDAVETAPPVQ